MSGHSPGGNSTVVDKKVDDAPEQERSKAYYIGIIVMLGLALEVTGFEFTFVFPAIPHIAADFQTTQVSWTFTILYLVGGLAVPMLGKLADIIGKKRVLIGTMVSFAIGCLVCATTSSFAIFLVGRGLQAVTLAASVIAFGLVRDLLPARWVPIGLGGLATGIGVSTLLGPLVGGWIIDNHGFRMTFVVLLVYIVAVVLVMLVFLPESKVRIRQRIDVVGGLLLGVGVAGVLFALSWHGQGRWLVAVASVALMGTFIAWQRRAAEPLMDLSLLGKPRFLLTLVTTACFGFTISGWAYVLPQLLQTPSSSATPHGFGLTAWDVALWQGMPQGLGSMTAGVLGGFLARRYGPRIVLIGSGVFFAAPCLILAGSIGTDSATLVRTCAVMIGIATGFYFSSTQNLIVEAVPADRQGVSGAMNFTAQSVFGGIATAGLATILSSFVVVVVAGGQYQLFSDTGFRNALLLCGALPVIGLVVAVLRRDGREAASGGVVSGMH